MDSEETHLTTLKVSPRIGGGLRLMAAIQGISVATLGDEAVREALRQHHRRSKPVKKPASGRTGRPGPTLEEAARAVSRLRPTRNDAIPTRISADTAKKLGSLAEQLGLHMGNLAEEGARALLARETTPKLVRDVAGLGTDRAYEEAIERVRAVAEGRLEAAKLFEPAKRKPRPKRKPGAEAHPDTK